MENIINNKEDRSKRKNLKLFVPVTFIVVLLVLSLLFYFNELLQKTGTFPTVDDSKNTSLSTKFEKFKSEEEFKNYLSKSDNLTDSLTQRVSNFGIQPMAQMERGDLQEISMQAPSGFGTLTNGSAPSRISTTNVQVAGIDEPDIIKTDGKSIFFSNQARYLYSDIPAEPVFIERESTILPPDYLSAETKIINVFPPSELENVSSIEQNGDILLSKNALIIFVGNTVYGYDVKDKKNPKRKWELEIDSKNTIVSSRLYDTKIYIVTRATINQSHPCPVPLIGGTHNISISCNDIYHPSSIIPTNVTFNLLLLNPESGDIEEKTSFLGSSGASVIYMSENAIYVTFSFYGSTIDFMYNFFSEKAFDLIDSTTFGKIDKLRNYEISERSKLIEFEIILQEYMNQLSLDDRLKLENEISNRLEDYVKVNGRELESSGIVKIRLDDLKINSTGSVPGRPLNQFSLDEYKDHLRIITTVNENVFGTQHSANDIYILSSDMNIVGKVVDLGLTERVYSARFIKDRGYIVTFRQVDPFYVLDLSNPTSPKLEGELKIPGYSSYLHPIDSNKILGVGKEGSKVKLSLFDVSNSKDPQEVDKYILDEYHSDILNTHHAFLMDTKHSVFFLPGSRGGYIFSYNNNQLEIVKAISDITAKRAIYLDDYMYIVSDEKILVINENDWQEVNSLTLN
jgi:uncharacterized secreted protein with C-terminal beta-propeller domain